mgnify:CR=1 FL=1
MDQRGSVRSPHHDYSAGRSVPVDNYGYSGPNATVAPFNQKTVTRHYGFAGAWQARSRIVGVATAVVIR